MVPGDKINIGFGFPGGAYDRGPNIDIQNLSAHVIKIRDLGFIRPDGSKFSLYDHEAACSGRDEATSIGSGSLEPRAICYARYGHDLVYLGAYAQTTTQKYPRMIFNSDVTLIKKIATRLKMYGIY